MIDTCRRQRMRLFVNGSTSRAWTPTELEWMKHAYLEGRPVICPVCDSRVELCSNEGFSCLRCPSCRNSNEPHHYRPTVIKPR